MRTKHIIFDLLNYLDEFENQHNDSEKKLSTADFIGYLNAVHVPDTLSDDKIRGGEESWKVVQYTENRTATNVSILVSLLYRYAKMYSRKAMKDSGIKTVDEFAILITLMTHAIISKQELIKEQVLEKTSGIEIVNRLIRQGYIEQFDGEKDRRSKMLKITEAGRMEIIQILPRMNQVSKIVVGNLTQTEQNLLTYLMRKLDDFHNDIFMNEKDAGLEDILRKVTPSE
jgi:DNA-binding MarR family transcriptional regulator